MEKKPPSIHMQAILYVLPALHLIPSVLWTLLSGNDFLKSILDSFFPSLIAIALLMSCVKSLWFGSAILSLLTLPLPAEIWYLLKYNHPSNTHLFGIMMETNVAEALEYGAGSLTLLALFTILIFASGAAITIVAYKKKWSWSGRTRYLIFIGGLAGFLIPVIAYMPNSREPDTKLTRDIDVFTRPILAPVFEAYINSWPLGLPIRILAYVGELKALKEAKRQTNDHSFRASYSGSVYREDRPIIVVVIGETSRPDRWQLYGYKRNTTPKLKKRENLIVFKDVISPWAWTRMSVPIMLTRKPADNPLSYFPEKSFISAFNEAGFSTHWVSNQSALGMHDAPTTLYASEAKTLKFTSPTSYKQAGSFDGVLLESLSQLLEIEELNGVSNGTLIVLHMMGSHFNYNYRYPEEYRVFLPDRPAKGVLSLHDSNASEELNNAYDNSILYSDYVIDGIIQRLTSSNRPAALLFVADHGENLYDGDCNLSGHGHETEYDFRVPALFWWSDKFEKRDTDKVAAAQQNHIKKISTTSIFHSVLNLGSVSYFEENLSKSFFSLEYQYKPRWVNASSGIDFDNSTKDGKCKKLVIKKND